MRSQGITSAGGPANGHPLPVPTSPHRRPADWPALAPRTSRHDWSSPIPASTDLVATARAERAAHAAEVAVSRAALPGASKATQAAARRTKPPRQRNRVRAEGAGRWDHDALAALRAEAARRYAGGESAKDVAAWAGWSLSALYRNLREAGQPVRKRRIDVVEARRLLDELGSVEAVATALGFSVTGVRDALAVADGRRPSRRRT